MKRISCVLFLLLLLTSCDQKFEKSGWVYKDDMEYPKRRRMVNDLVENYKLKGMTYSQITNLLGNGENGQSEKNKLFYDIIVNYGFDIDPVYIKYLERGFTKDSIVNSFKIVEWKK